MCGCPGRGFYIRGGYDNYPPALVEAGPYFSQAIIWHEPQSVVHLSEKPVELAARTMRYSSRPGERVLDLFGESGSTLIAAEQEGRKARLMEIDPAYCDVIVAR